MNNLYNLGGVNQAPASLSSSSSNSDKAAVSLKPVADAGKVLPEKTGTQTEFAAKLTTTELVKQAVSDLSSLADSRERSLSFSFNDDLGDTVIVVKDKTTDEVVRQIPSEFAIQLAQNLNRLRETLDVSNNAVETELQSFFDSKGNLFDASV